MFEQTTKQKTDMLMNAPMVEWSDLQHGMFEETKAEIVKDLDELIERAVRLRGYLDMRRNGTHHEGVKASNSLAEKIRRALGYTQARNEVRF